jgi:hypothetical protein
VTFHPAAAVTLDPFATSILVERVATSAGVAHRVASRVDDALEALVPSTSCTGAPGIITALSAFVHARQGTGRALANQLDSVAASTRAAVEVLTHADDAVARRSESLL